MVVSAGYLIDGMSNSIGTPKSRDSAIVHSPPYIYLWKIGILNPADAPGSSIQQGTPSLSRFIAGMSSERLKYG